MGLGMLLCMPVSLTSQSVIDPAQAKDFFARARRVSEKDGGKLWGKPLYGAMLLVDPQTRQVVANQPDGEGHLKLANGGLYTGTLPESILLANMPIEWSGTRWTMLMWPPSGDQLTINKVLAHEMFHRIQKSLGIPMDSPQNPHLDTPEGRVWLQLEWRAWATALASEGAAQQKAVADACSFRTWRYHLFPGAQEDERPLEVSEGVAEYTGLVTATPDAASARWYEIAQLTLPDRNNTFVRSFPYTVGPALGLLLDERQPGWRLQLGHGSDPGGMLCRSIRNISAADTPVRSAHYGAAGIRAMEQEREHRLAAQKQRYRALLIEGPTLTLPNSGSFSFNFNLRELVSLGAEITVYPTSLLQNSSSCLI